MLSIEGKEKVASKISSLFPKNSQITLKMVDFPNDRFLGALIFGPSYRGVKFRVIYIGRNRNNDAYLLSKTL